MKKKILLALVVIMVAIQFMPAPQKNDQSSEGLNDIQHVFGKDSALSAILEKSCYDCHSNHTSYPWYSSAQPLAQWIGHHIKEGKEELNFSKFGDYSAKKQYHKLEEVVEQLEEDEMPLTSYRIMHRKASLSEKEKEIIISWAQKSMMTLRSKDQQ